MSIATLVKKIALAGQAMTLMVGFGGATLTAVAVSAGPVYAAPGDCATDFTDPLKQGAACSQGNSQKETLFGQGGIFTTVANTLIFLVGAVSVIFLIIGGLRYVISNGDSKAVTAAKDTILYAIIGVVVAVVSFALVSFVTTALANAK